MSMLIHLLGCTDPKDYPPDLFPLKDDEHFIGRLPSCHIRMDDDSISRLHARIFRKDGDWWIEDIRSRNGVLINARSVSSAKLVEGDIITTGEVYLTLSHRRADQIEHIRDWVEERVQDAMDYDQQIIKLNAHKKSARESSLLDLPPSAEEFIATSAPNSDPPAHERISAMPDLSPQPATPHPQPAAVSHSHPPHSSHTHSRPAAKSRPLAQNVIGKDPTVIVICAVTGVLIVIALIWKYSGLFG
jgi:predicted component of type VI protein secretion system